MRVSKKLFSLVILIALLASTASVASAGKPLVITNPSVGEAVSGTYLITGGGSGTAVEVSFDYDTWHPAVGGKSWSYSWETTAYADGPITIYARYTDQSSEKSVSVTVSNSSSGDTCTASAGDVLINEVLPAPSAGSEWVELYNATGSDVDISYCYLDDLADAGGAPVQIPAGTTVPANGFWTMDFGSYYNNTGDDVRLLSDDATTVLDSYSYGATGYDESWYRSPDGGDWAAYRYVDFDAQPANTFQARAGSPAYGGLIEIHLDAPDGELVGTCAVPRTGGWRKWSTVSCPVKRVSGVRAVYLVFKGTGTKFVIPKFDPERLFDLESFWFSAQET